MTPEDFSRALAEGADLFNRGFYFDCHEVLEGFWKGARGEEKLFLQGLIQAAAGLHQLKLGSPPGAVRLLRRALDKLERSRMIRGPSWTGFARGLSRAALAIEAGSFRSEDAPAMPGTIV